MLSMVVQECSKEIQDDFQLINNQKMLGNMKKWKSSLLFNGTAS